jgi:hypothetical protein
LRDLNPRRFINPQHLVLGIFKRETADKACFGNTACSKNKAGGKNRKKGAS